MLGWNRGGRFGLLNANAVESKSLHFAELHLADSHHDFILSILLHFSCFAANSFIVSYSALTHIQFAL